MLTATLAAAAEMLLPLISTPLEQELSVFAVADVREVYEDLGVLAALVGQGDREGSLQIGEDLLELGKEEKLPLLTQAVQSLLVQMFPPSPQAPQAAPSSLPRNRFQQQQPPQKITSRPQEKASFYYSPAYLTYPAATSSTSSFSDGGASGAGGHHKSTAERGAPSSSNNAVRPATPSGSRGHGFYPSLDLQQQQQQQQRQQQQQSDKQQRPHYKERYDQYCFQQQQKHGGGAFGSLSSPSAAASTTITSSFLQNDPTGRRPPLYLFSLPLRRRHRATVTIKQLLRSATYAFKHHHHTLMMVGGAVVAAVAALGGLHHFRYYLGLNI